MSFFTPSCSDMSVRNGEHERLQNRDCNREAENVEGKIGDLARWEKAPVMARMPRHKKRARVLK